MKYIFLFIVGTGAWIHAGGQLQVAGNMQIATGATVATPGDIYLGDDITGNGNLLLNNTSGIQQDLDGNGYIIPVLEVHNSAHIRLVSDVRIGEKLKFTEGKIRLDGSDMSFLSGALHEGADTGKYIVSDGSGTVNAWLDANHSFTFPVGTSLAYGDYTPARISNSAAARKVTVGVKDYNASDAVIHNGNSGVDRVWYITADEAGDADIELTHNPDAEGTDFDRNAAFVTRQLEADGSRWSIGTPGAGLQHTGSFTLPSGTDATSYFSKSSNTDSSLGLHFTAVTRLGEIVLQMTVYPNPFTDETILKITSSGNMHMQYHLTDITGRYITGADFTVNEGVHNLPLPVAGLAAGVYQVHLADAAGIQSTIKIIKK